MTAATIEVLHCLYRGGFVCMEYSGRPAIYNSNSDYVRMTNRPFIERLVKLKLIEMSGKLFRYLITPGGKQALQDHINKNQCR